MWKKNKSFSLLRPNPLSSQLLSSFFYTVAPQKMQTFKDHRGSFYESMAHLCKIKQAGLDFYHFKTGQTIASIGGQCCHIEAANAATNDSMTFYLEEIDIPKFKKEQVEFIWNYYKTF